MFWYLPLIQSSFIFINFLLIFLNKFSVKRLLLYLLAIFFFQLGFTPLHLAAGLGLKGPTLFLLRHGAMVDPIDGKGRSAHDFVMKLFEKFYILYLLILCILKGGQICEPQYYEPRDRQLEMLHIFSNGG